MVPQNLLRGTGRAADYIISGSWGKKAIEEARREGNVRVAWDGKPTNYDRLPSAAELQLDANAAYVHFTSNETIQGVQFDQEPEVGDVPLVCDASSDFLSRPLPIERYGLIYACAQKNVGPAGVTVVILREDLLERSSDALAGMLDYRNHVRDRSLYNTPPTFAVYMVNLVARWLQDEIGGLAAMRDRNRRKAKLLYDQIDQSEGFYTGHARREDRSQMNVTFRLPDAATTGEFLRQAREHELESLEGHRSVGGIRASIYNAMPEEGVQRLAEFMHEFREARAG
jgi:phosphoserine aminotransferase